MEINLRGQDSFSGCTIETHGTPVMIKNHCQGLTLVNKWNEQLEVRMGDDGFELHYVASPHMDFWLEIKDGVITRSVRDVIQSDEGEKSEGD